MPGLQRSGDRLVVSLGVPMIVKGLVLPGRADRPRGAFTCSRQEFSPCSWLAVDGPAVGGASMSARGLLLWPVEDICAPLIYSWIKVCCRGAVVSFLPSSSLPPPRLLFVSRALSVDLLRQWSSRWPVQLVEVISPSLSVPFSCSSFRLDLLFWVGFPPAKSSIYFWLEV
jgi:hypothetical protein